MKACAWLAGMASAAAAIGFGLAGWLRPELALDLASALSLCR